MTYLIQETLKQNITEMPTNLPFLLWNKFYIKSPWCQRYLIFFALTSNIIRTIRAEHRGSYCTFSRNQMCLKRRLVKYNTNFSTSSFYYHLKNTHFREVDPTVFIQITHKKVFHKNWCLELKFSSETITWTRGDLLRVTKYNWSIALDMC